MDDFWHGIRTDFSDIPSGSEFARLLVRLVMASLLGGVLGWERETTGKSAGLRTHMLVALGSAMFAIIPLQAGMAISDFSRVLQGLMAGIGFIGAGAILKQSDEHRVQGLTTAAGLWLTAGIGLAAGMGREVTAILGTILTFIILAFLQRTERWFVKQYPRKRSD